MKISVFGLDIQPQKYTYSCECFGKLVKKFNPQKASPFRVEFIEGEFEKTDAVVFDSKKKFDFVFMDFEKVEKRLERLPDEKERNFLMRVQKMLEKEMLLCDCQFDPQEEEFLKLLSFVTYKPSLGKESIEDINTLIKEVLDKAGVLLFYTVAKKEVRAWELKRGATVLDAAARIHSDLARGFIKADVVNCKEIDNFFNMAEARAKGLVKQVGKDYIMEDRDIIEVKFSV